MFKQWTLLPLMGMACLASLARAAPLGFFAALDRAERQSPGLAARSAQIDAARFSAVTADALPDPKLFIGVDNLPVTGPDRGSFSRDFMTMQKIGVVQDVPNADKRHARAVAAVAETDLAEAERRVERLRVRRATALAWLARYFLERRLALFGELDQENRILAAAVRAQFSANRAQPADTVMPKQEAAQLADRRDELARDLAKTKSDLRRFVGADADESLGGEPPDFSIDPDHLRQHVQHHPELAVFEPMTRKAQAQVNEAEAMKKSDWSVQVGYQQRGPQYSDMASVQVTFDLPFFTKTRQDPQIAARREELIRIDAEREAMLRDHTAELESELANYTLLSRQLDRLKQTWLPLTQGKVELQLAGYRAGKSDIAAVLAARRELIDLRLKRIELEGQRAAVAATVYFAYGEGRQ